MWERWSTKRCHAHWHCVQSAAGCTLFSCAVNAASDNDFDKADNLVRKLEDCLKAGIQGIGNFFFRLDCLPPPTSGGNGQTTMNIRILTSTFQELRDDDDDDIDGSSQKPFSYSNLKLELLNSNSDFIPNVVRDQALSVFTELAKAESKVRGSDMDDVTISLRSIIQVLGTLLFLYGMGVESTSCSPIPLAVDGTSNLSLKSAIITNLLVGMPICLSSPSIDDEPSTPVGIAMLRYLARQGSIHHHSWPSMILRTTGMGVNRSNTKVMVRVFIGDDCSKATPVQGIENETTNSRHLLESDLWLSDTVTHMETNVDDTTGENLAHVIQLLLENGALDAWVTPIVMKKGRPAYTLNCLCLAGAKEHEQTAKRLLQLIFRHTTTLGVRFYSDIGRAKLQRSFVEVKTPYKDNPRNGVVSVKVGSFNNGEVVSVKAEFDHCREIAMATGVPLRTISECAERKALESDGGNK